MNKRCEAPPDTPWRRWSPWGKVHHAGGHGPSLLAAGWLPRRAAAAAMGLRLGDFDRLYEDGAIRSRAIGPGARLYEVTRA